MLAIPVGLRAAILRATKKMIEIEKASPED